MLKKKMLKLLWFRCKINKYYVYTITFLPEVIVNDQISLSYITNGLQITDIFTSFYLPLSSQKLLSLLDNIKFGIVL